MSAAPVIRRSAIAPALETRPFDARIGLIVLATDHTSEDDFRRMVASDRVRVHVARIAYANPVTPENLRRMQPALTEAAALLLPEEDLEAICYSCTSASVVIGDDAVEAAITAAKPGAKVVTPTLAAVTGLRALGASRISILTPYTAETSRPMGEYFLRHGFSIASFTCLGMDDDREMARISADSLHEIACASCTPDAEALFISCTALRAAPIAGRIEAALGRPVVTSNQATAWQCLGAAGLAGPEGGAAKYGRLLSLPLSRATLAPRAPQPGS